MASPRHVAGGTVRARANRRARVRVPFTATVLGRRLLYRLIGRLPVPRLDSMRTIVMRDGTRLTYRLNLAQNGIVAFVVEAAVGGRDGFAFFARTSEWLMMEFHPEVADPAPIAHAIRAQGFTFYPAGTLRAADIHDVGVGASSHGDYRVPGSP